ncbi:MAG: penicillin-binding protein 1A [Gammaproteobacteria bacterium]
MHNHPPDDKGLYSALNKKFFWRLLPFALGLMASLLLCILAGGFAGYYYLQPALPSVSEMRDRKVQIPLRIYSRDGLLIGQVGEKKRTPIDYKNIPDRVINAFLAAEDDRFFEHPGFDYQGITRAAIILLTTGSKAQGGSTITQQLAREYFLTRDRTFVRKAKELILAIQIESAFTKQEILELYLNKIFLGQRSYGVAAAAEVYFGKTLNELSIAEAATIAGLPAAPSRLNPVANPDQSTDRRSYVLRRMRELSFITAEEFDTAMNTPMMSRLHGPKVQLEAPYAAELARSEMVRRYGTAAYTDGYQVITTIDSTLQRASNKALQQALLNYDRRHGYRGPVAQVDPEEVISSYRESKQELSEDEITTNVIEDSFALQDLLKDFSSYDFLQPAIVTSVDIELNSAELFVRDTGPLELSWEQIKWPRYINDNVKGSKPLTVTDVINTGDVIYVLNTRSGYRLGQLPEAQGAFVALNPNDGATVAMTGGFSYAQSSFNRATQASRQPGSAFKPFIYSAGLENGFTAATIVNDAPIVLNSLGQEEAWRPENYSKKFYGPSRLREGLVKSMNLVSIRVLREIGIRNTLNHLEPFGMPESALPRDLSLALGTGGMSPWDLAEAYGVIASGGLEVNRYYIDRVLDARGNLLTSAEPVMICERCEDRWYDGREEILDPQPDFLTADGEDTAEEASEEVIVEENLLIISPEIPEYDSAENMIAEAREWQPDFSETPLFWDETRQAKRIITEQNAYIIYDMMRDVIKRGTGRRARDLGRPDLAGKTGTSNNRRDAWFSGFNQDLVGIAWVGFDDDSRSLGAGEAGGSTALPMWKDFMAVALEDTAEASMLQPEGIVSVRISSTTGELAPYGSKDARFEIFRAGNEPNAESEKFNFDQGDIFVEDGGDEFIF